VDQEKQKISRQALALLKYYNKIPETKRQDYQRNIRQWHNLSSDYNLTQDILIQTSEMNTTTPNPKYIPGPVLVVQPLIDALQHRTHDDKTRSDGSHDTNDAALVSFVQDWRAYFVETSNPRFLPTGWDVCSPVRCDGRGSTRE
jgi:hypothetical protein